MTNYLRFNVLITDVDECLEEPCLSGATCTTPQFASFQCQCAPGFNGDLCQFGMTLLCTSITRSFNGRQERDNIF